MKKVYISGRISGLPREQYAKYFAEAERMLKADGYDVVNPTRFWLCKCYERLERLLGADTTYRIVLLYDIWRMLRCDMIYKIPGWQQSRGANIESCVAYHLNVWPVRKDTIKDIDMRLQRIIRKDSSIDDSKPKTKKQPKRKTS